MGSVTHQSLIAGECAALDSATRACRHYRVDLHVHSPASLDFADEVKDGAQRALLKKMTPDDFVQAWSNSGAELIAITDHNTGAFLDGALKAAAKLRKAGQAITVLPGVELTVVPGVHYLAVLPTGGTAEIDHLLSTLKVSPSERGKETALISDLEDVAREVHELGGLLIAAHCQSADQGVVGKLKGQTRNQALHLVDALELSCSAAQPQKTIGYVRTDLKCELPFVFGSDNHDATNFVEPMWVKMAEPTFQGLRQLVYEPELRVSRTVPTNVSHGWICSCSTTGGIYQTERFGFSPHLNVLIGGRGAGKSAAIDLIRFAFGVEPTDPDKLRSFSSRIAGFLDGAHEVVVGIQCSDGERYVVVRSGLYTPDKKREAIFSQQPIVYQVTGDSYLESSASPLELLPVEFYAQGDVVMLADHAEQQMRLIDDNIDFGDLKQQAARLDQDCEELEEQIDELLQTEAKLEAKTSDEGELQKRVKYLNEQLKDPIFDAYEAWTNEMNALDAYAQWLAKQRTNAKLKIDTVPAHTIDATKTPQPKIMTDVSTLIASVRSSLGLVDKSANATIDDAQKKLAGMRSTWDKAFAEAKEAYLQKLKDLNATNRAAAAEERAKKQKTLQEIETETKPALKKARADLKTIVVKRTGLVTKLISVRSQIHGKRVKLVKDLNAQLKGQVVIEFESSPDRTAVADYLIEALDGSGMQNRQAQLQGLCDGLDGVAIATAVRNQDRDTLTKQGKLSSASAKLVLTNVVETDLMVIERLETPTLPRVLLRRQGETQYTELGRLSVGEKCSAILSVALLNKDKPLVIDQPEDELDHAFVTESIVESIRTVKGVRQIIAATHNPNIPVLGDAEIVFRVNRTTGSGVGTCEIKACGGLELEPITEEVQLLEGGPEAFEQRGRRYGLNRRS